MNIPVRQSIFGGKKLLLHRLNVHYNYTASTVPCYESPYNVFLFHFARCIVCAVQFCRLNQDINAMHSMNVCVLRYLFIYVMRTCFLPAHVPKTVCVRYVRLQCVHKQGMWWPSRNRIVSVNKPSKCRKYDNIHDKRPRMRLIYPFCCRLTPSPFTFALWLRLHRPDIPLRRRYWCAVCCAVISVSLITWHTTPHTHMHTTPREDLLTLSMQWSKASGPIWWRFRRSFRQSADLAAFRICRHTVMICISFFGKFARANNTKTHIAERAHWVNCTNFSLGSSARESDEKKYMYSG